MPSIGPYELYEIDAGRFGLDGGAMFGIIPKPLWSRKTTPDDHNRIPLSLRCLLLAASDRLVLVDAGIGNKYSPKFRDIYAIDDERSNLIRSLQRAGFGPDDVTDVILTHLHFDHCGGGTRRSKSGGVDVTFRNAVYHVQKTQWETAEDSNLRERASFLSDNLDPLKQSGQLQFADGKATPLPHIDVIPVNGHTRGMQIVKVSGDEGTLVYVADLLPTSAHLAPAWTMAYDVRPLESMREKAAFLASAIEHGWSIFFEHDPRVAVMNVVAGERGPEGAAPRPLSDL